MGKHARALVAGWKPPMIVVDSVSTPKSEVNWTDAEEQASIRNVRTLNAIFNGVDLNMFKLINSCSSAKEAWKILKVAYEAEYNERVLGIANESNLEEKIPKTKIVQKVLCSLPRKFNRKVTAREEAHDITKLKQDELFGSLLIMDGDNYQRRDGEGRIFKCKDYEEVGHYQTECPTFLRKQKKNFCATLFDEDTDDSEEDYRGTNAFIVNITETDSVVEDESEDSEEESGND
ncbi:gag-pol polyprotein [Cucumis melo var. makuwa]|uniref:Gag-pol polyprotein n=1 Tax=Cucumis melo var. makuwa TaxID=1194695 RepID=A0A5A7T2Y4_CUCMM|nr:gag-pol polyprotein [Cucumis melo var. makuwa]TYK19087.1 gag-pol polyprotein [Cucumis melo var. makuwa]